MTLQIVVLNTKCAFWLISYLCFICSHWLWLCLDRGSLIACKCTSWWLCVHIGSVFFYFKQIQYSMCVLIHFWSLVRWFASTSAMARSFVECMYMLLNDLKEQCIFLIQNRILFYVHFKTYFLFLFQWFASTAACYVSRSCLECKWLYLYLSFVFFLFKTYSQRLLLWSGTTVALTLIDGKYVSKLNSQSVFWFIS
jgi:hypothetical protein